MKKIGIYSLIFLLVFSMIPMPSIDSVSAESEEEETEDIVLFAEEEGDDINLYSSKEDVEADESEIDIPDESEALLIHDDSTFEYDDQLYVFIQYEDEDSEDDTGQLVEGYVDAERVVFAEDVEEFLKNRQQGEETESEDNNSDEAEEVENDESSEDDDGNVVDSEENDEAVKEDEKNTDSEENDESTDNNEKEKSPTDSDSNDKESEDNESEELDEEDNFSPAPYSDKNARNIVEKKISKLARINNGQVNIYESIGGQSKKAGSKYTDFTYYVKKQAVQGADTYYLISEDPRSNIVGWVKSDDVKSFDHKSVDKKSKTFYVKGNGNARSKAWGAKKDHVYSDLSKYAGEIFEVHLTEKVGNNTWYRGKLDGKTVWLHSNFVTKTKESKTSKLARINNGEVNIYESVGGKSKKAGSKYTDVTYYVKKQAVQGADTYYLISEDPRSNIVGWIKSDDVESFDHKSVDKKSKTFYVKGNGNARSKAWGAKKDHVYSDLSKYVGDTFKVHLTEKVGNNTWYRGKLDGKTVWLHSNFVTQEKEIKTSKLARINNSGVDIYENIGGKSKKAGSKYTDVTYYVKKQTKQGADTYYLISEDPKSNIVGWVKSSDVESFDHKSVDKKSKTFYVKGNGNARSKAWGAKKDHVYSDLSQYAGEIFEVHLTEKVGNNTWYRGELDGKTVWLHSNFVTKTEISKTSKLARINDSQVNIFESVGGKSKKAGSKYTDVTYYVKKQTKQGADTYYLISEDPKSNIVGWVKSSDVESFTHQSVDKKSKTFFVKGNGNARSKAWGAKKDHVYSDLSKYAGDTFKVHLTEKVGNNTWYRGKLDGKIVWLHSNFVTQESKTSKLARINNSQVNIYENVGGKSKKAGSKHTDVTYYVKKQAIQGADIYYLISEDPKSNIIGWVKSSDVESFVHKSVDKKSKTFYVKGNGNARSKAWGAKKDHVYSDLSKYAGDTFKVHLTEKVGNNTWYRGKLGGKTVWLHSNFVSSTKKTIVIDPGHGGKDPGTSSNGLVEKSLVLDISKNVVKKLRAEGYAVIITRSNDKYLELWDRTNIANKAKADLFLSIHANAGGGQGIETWWYNKGYEPNKSKNFATVVQSEVIKETKANNRGVKNGNLYVNRESKMPSSLVEVGFLDNPNDAKKLKQKKYKEEISKGITNGIKKYLSR